MTTPLFGVRPVALFIALISLVPSLAAQTVWNAGSGNWATAGNWSPATVPTSGTDVQIDNGGTAVVSAGQSVASNSTSLGTGIGDSGHATITGAGASWQDNNYFMAGYGGTGSLTISAGGTARSVEFYGGANSTGSGVITVTGAGSSLIVDGGGIYLGYGGGSASGVLTIAEGATVTNNGGSMYLGSFDSNSGSGTFNIGGAVNATAVAPGNYTGPGIAGAPGGSALVNFNHTGAAYTFATAIAGTAAVQHNGSGTTLLTAVNNYTGTTTVNAGALFINGSSATSIFTVNSGGTLGGSGTIGGLTTIASGGHLAPGGALSGAGSAGTLTFTHGLTLTAGAILDFQLGTSSDMIALTGGTLTSNSGIILNLSDGGGFAAGNYTLFDFSTGSTNVTNFHAGDFTFGTLPAGTNASDFLLTLSATSLSLSYSGSAIPEPSTYAAIFGACALGLAVWRKRRATAPLAA